MVELDIRAPGAPEELEMMVNRVADVCLGLEGVRACDAYALLTDDDAIRTINARERGIDAPTDVLSFPSIAYPSGTARDHPKLLRREVDAETGRPFLGDIVISLPRARAQAAEYGHSLRRELGFLTAHAMFHLLGYDHMADLDRAAMRAMEERAMAELKLFREDADMNDDILFQMACEAMKNAYAPYSGFKVGACLLADDGRTFSGCNIENASFGATICAERAAIARAVSDGARKFQAVAIAAEQSAAWPCGICRQVLNEFSSDMRVLVGRAGGGFQQMSLPDLLPKSFGPNDLDQLQEVDH